MSANAPGDETSATPPAGSANTAAGCCVVSFVSNLTTAGTICFAARLGAGVLDPNGALARAPAPSYDPTSYAPNVLTGSTSSTLA